MHTKIAGPFRVDSTDTPSEQAFQLDGRSGGSACKVILYTIRTLQASANAELGLSIQQSPDGDNYGDLSGVIATAAVPASRVQQNATGTPDTDAADVLNEWIRPSVLCDSSDASPSWAVVEVWETRKAF